MAVIGICGTLGGIWFGHWLERRNETRKWRRERCLEAYTEVFRSCDIVGFEADKAYHIECGSLAHDEQKEVLLEKVAEMYRTVDKTVLLGSQEVHKKLQDLTVYCGKEIAAKSIICPKLSESEWHKIRVEDFPQLYSDCIIAARNDLEIFPKRYSTAGLAEIEKSIEELEEELSKGTISPDKVKLRIQKIKMELKKDKKKVRTIHRRD